MKKFTMGNFYLTAEHPACRPYCVRYVDQIGDRVEEDEKHRDATPIGTRPHRYGGDGTETER